MGTLEIFGQNPGRLCMCLVGWGLVGIGEIFEIRRKKTENVLVPNLHSVLVFIILCKVDMNTTTSGASFNMVFPFTESTGAINNTTKPIFRRVPCIYYRFPIGLL